MDNSCPIRVVVLPAISRDNVCFGSEKVSVSTGTLLHGSRAVQHTIEATIVAQAKVHRAEDVYFVFGDTAASKVQEHGGQRQDGHEQEHKRQPALVG